MRFSPPPLSAISLDLGGVGILVRTALMFAAAAAVSVPAWATCPSPYDAGSCTPNGGLICSASGAQVTCQLDAGTATPTSGASVEAYSYTSGGNPWFRLMGTDDASGTICCEIDMTQMSAVLIVGTDDDDTISLYYGATNLENVTCTVEANSGNDDVNGSSDTTSYSETLRGESGSDTIDGRLGDDVLEGGDHVDTITGGDGNDTIFGGYGMDTLSGDEGNDTIYGDFASDPSSGDADDIYGGGGNDTCEGGGGDDWMGGGDGVDVLSGGDGDDGIKGGAGNDTLNGGEGDDSVCGQAGMDDVNGDNGDYDQVYQYPSSGMGSDTADGGVGTNDRCGAPGSNCEGATLSACPI